MIEQEEEFYQILQELSMFHSVFSTLWRIGVPCFDTKISTAAVTFDREGYCINFVFNKEFWDRLDNYSRSFVICHECLHVILNHGVRGKGCNPSVANIAMDIAVNHMLVDGFDFVRELVIDYDKYCWVDTIFPDEVVPADKNFEFYYEKLMKDAIDISGFSTVDEHSVGSGGIPIPGGMPAPGGKGEEDEEGAGEDEEESEFTFPSSDIDESIPDLIKDAIGDALSPEELEDLKEETSTDKVEEDRQGSLGHPGEPLIPGSAPHTFASKKKVDRMWDDILSKIEKTVKHNYQSQFIFTNRRMVFLGGDFLLPNDYEIEDMEVDKPKVYLYLDCSGSCHSHKDVFFDLAATIDPKKYDVKLFARTTQVREMTKIGPKQYKSNAVGGSDDYRCIERHIQQELKEGKIKKYPVVIHMTDGGDCSGVMVNPAKPEMWFWILISHYWRWVPTECKNRYIINGDKLKEVQ